MDHVLCLVRRPGAAAELCDHAMVRDGIRWHSGHELGLAGRYDWDPSCCIVHGGALLVNAYVWWTLLRRCCPCAAWLGTTSCMDNRVEVGLNWKEDRV